MRKAAATILLLFVVGTATAETANGPKNTADIRVYRVLTDVGGAREMIDDGVEGYIVSSAELEARLPGLIAGLAFCLLHVAIGV